MMTSPSTAAAPGMASPAAAPAEPFVHEAADAHGVLTLTLNRPASFNALSAAMLTALQQALDRAAADPAVRLVVLAGAGRAFCAGHDLREMRAMRSEAELRALFDQCGRVMLTLQQLPVPVVARVQGIATAAGCQLVAQCDLAVAAQDARFAVSGVNLGLFCSTPGVALSRNLSRKAAFEMLVTGEFISAAQALERGLVNRVVPAEALDAAVAELAGRIVSKPRDTLALGKALFYRQLETGLAPAYADAAATMACNMMDPAAQEGVQAFLEKRPPGWAVPALRKDLA